MRVSVVRWLFLLQAAEAPWTSYCFSVPAHDFVSPQPLSAQTERLRVHDSPASPARGRGPTVPASSWGLEQFIVVCGPPGPQGSEGTVGHRGDPGWICWLLMPEFPQGTRKGWILPKALERSKPCSPPRVHAPLHTPRKDMPSQPSCPAQPVAPGSERAAERAGRRPHCFFAPLGHSPLPIPPAVQATPPTVRAEGNAHFPALADPVVRNLDRTQWGSLSLRQDIQSPRRRQRLEASFLVLGLDWDGVNSRHSEDCRWVVGRTLASAGSLDFLPTRWPRGAGL